MLKTTSMNGTENKLHFYSVQVVCSTGNTVFSSRTKTVKKNNKKPHFPIRLNVGHRGNKAPRVPKENDISYFSNLGWGMLLCRMIYSCVIAESVATRGTRAHQWESEAISCRKWFLLSTLHREQSASPLNKCHYDGAVVETAFSLQASESGIQTDSLKVCEPFVFTPPGFLCWVTQTESALTRRLCLLSVIIISQNAFQQPPDNIHMHTMSCVFTVFRLTCWHKWKCWSSNISVYMQPYKHNHTLLI